MSIFRDRAALIWLALHSVCVGCFRRRHRSRRGLKYNLSLVDATAREKNGTSQTWTKIQITRFFHRRMNTFVFHCPPFFRCLCAPLVADAIVVEFAFSSELLSLLLPYFFSLFVCLFRSFVLSPRSSPRSLSLSLARQFPISWWKMVVLVVQVQCAHTGKQMHELLSQDFTFWCCAVCARRLSFFQIKSTLSGFPFDFPFQAIVEQTTSCIVVAAFGLWLFFLDDRKTNSSTSHHKHGKRNAANQIKQDINFNRTVVQWNVKFRMQRGVLCAGRARAHSIKNRVLQLGNLSLA